MEIFVYGTLLRGMCRFSALQHAEPLGPALAEGQLHDLGDYPGLLPGQDTVIGEVYRVDARTLERLDGIEDCYPDCPEASLYLRRSLEVRFLADGRRRRVESYFYAGPLDGAPPIRHGDYRRYVLERGGTAQWMAAYGSNSSRARLEARVGTVGERIRGHLPGFELVFNTADAGRSQVFANIRFCEQGQCPAILQRLTPQQMAILDGYEGTPRHYLRVALPFQPECGGAPRLAQLWIAQPQTLTDSLLAREEYLAHIRQGYREMDLFF